MAMVFEVEDVAKEVDLGWRMALTINGRSTFSGAIPSIPGTYRPALDNDFEAIDGVTPMFGGLITRSAETGFFTGSTAIKTAITASDYSILAEVRHITATIPSGTTLKAALLIALPYLQGVTLHAGQVDGPALPDLSPADQRVDAFLNDLSLHSGGYLWVIDSSKVLRMFLPGTVAAPFNIVDGPANPAEGDIVVEPKRKGYANRVIVRSNSLRAMAEDVPAQTAKGLIYEIVLTAPDNTSQDALDSIAVTALAKALVERREVRYRTRTPGLLPGMTQTINVAKRGINNTFLITEVTAVGIATGPVYEITALEGTTFLDGWREYLKATNGGSSTTVAGASGVVLQRFAYPLGGTGLDAAVAPGGSAWVPASGGGAIGQNPFQVQINTVARGTTAATIVGRLKADDASVGVKARLYDVTAAAACPGESALVTNTQWETVTFGTTLNPGSHFYELQLWSATAGAWVRAAGFYLE